MLRSSELLGIHRDELNPDHGTVDIPARRVKKRRVINQPLSDLALEILTESMGKHDFAFVGRFGDAPLARQAMSGALKGTRHRNGKVKTPGICELLGIAPFTPHDLRRTAATMCGNLGLSDSAICSVSTIKPPRERTANRYRRLPTKFTISLSSAVSSESAKCLTHGPSNCGASLAMFRLRTSLRSRCLRPDLSR
jgi:Phage integrase family